MESIGAFSLELLSESLRMGEKKPWDILSLLDTEIRRVKSNIRTVTWKGVYLDSLTTLYWYPQESHSDVSRQEYLVVEVKGTLAKSLVISQQH